VKVDTPGHLSLGLISESSKLLNEYLEDDQNLYYNGYIVLSDVD
jgi:hypothetical protein